MSDFKKTPHTDARQRYEKMTAAEITAFKQDCCRDVHENADDKRHEFARVFRKDSMGA